MTEPLRIANCSGFYGDRLSAAAEMVNGGPIDVLTGDWLAELTMLILARAQMRRPDGGYARTFVTQMEQVMGTCLDGGIKVVANAGGLAPRACAEAVHDVADKLGLAPTIAYVEGDNLLPRLSELIAAGVPLDNLDTGESIGDPARFITANAYLGCWGIVDALERGADIVITGRVTDAAVVCGPAAWHHGWARTDWDRLAGAVVAGHVIECGTQATGGNYSFFTELAGLAHTGFPWAEIAADGSSVIGKHDGTGGAVTVGTVTSQLLYEIGDAAYLGPDVTAHFDSVTLHQLGHDRVQIGPAKGSPPPATLKVAMNELGGYRTDFSVALTGLDIEAKAELVQEAFWAAAPVARHDIDSVTTRLVRTDQDDPQSNEQAVASWRVTLKDRDERKIGRPFANAINELALATIPGMFALAGSSVASPFGVYRPSLVPVDLVPAIVTVLGGETTIVESLFVDGAVADGPVADARPHDDPAITAEPSTYDPADAERAGLSLRRDEATPNAAGDDSQTWGTTSSLPLGTILGSRSGDKGGNANLGVFARDAETYEWMASYLTLERFRDLLPETRDLEASIAYLPNIWSINVVFKGLLQEGVAASTRQDGQAKSLGEWFRARHAEIPERLLRKRS